MLAANGLEPEIIVNNAGFGLVGAAAKLDRWTASIAHGLERMRDRGELSPQANPTDLATALLAALQGGLLLSRVSRSNEPLRKALDAMITLIKTQTVAPTVQTTTAAH